MKKIRHLFLFTITAFSVSFSHLQAVTPESVNRIDISSDKLYEGFRDPPAEARPFVRWWWNNNQVEEGEILRELDVLKAAGIGGIEINPIAASEPKVDSKAKVLTWRSPEWDLMLHVACKGAHERGMIVDLIAGSGWPFGGEFLKPDEQIMRLTVLHEEIKGAQSFAKPLKELFARKIGDGRHKQSLFKPSLAFAMLAPKTVSSIGQVKDVTESVDKDGILRIEVGTGDHVIAYGILEQGFRQVVNGARGAAGPTMDHMRKSVTRSYLNRLKGVEETWGEPLSTYVRAVFCDSIETAGANWTHDMAESFRKRKGYDITPYLPFVTGSEAEFCAFVTDPAFRDTLRRVRYDWNEHNVAIFLERFTAEYSAFCHDNRMLSRYQAYGTPYLMGMAEGYMIPDIPESNNWLYTVDPYQEWRYVSNYHHGYMIWTKYTSAGGRLRGKKIISTEAMTNTRMVFHCTLGTIKQSDDINFIGGMTHSVLHGFNYNPPDVPFPGLIRYGSYFSEYNTWWPYFKLWADYNARVSYVLQNTKPVSNIAIIGPTPDIWSTEGLVRQPFHMTPAYLHELWEPIAQIGETCDYLHEDVIRKARMENGELRYGPMNYKVLLVVDMETMRPETARALAEFTAAGGKLIFVNRVPERSPGLIDASANDAEVRKAVETALGTGAVKVQAPAPETPLRTWLTSTLKQAGFRQRMTIREPDDGLYQIQHTALDDDILFFANTRRKDPVRSRVDFKLGERGLWVWDPESGSRLPYALPYDANGLKVELRPMESVLLVTGAKEEAAVDRRASGGVEDAHTITGPWQVEFHPAQSSERFSTTLNSLTDFTASDDPRVKNFSGTATYTTVFNLDEAKYNRIELGWDNDFISEISLNGKPAGTNWYGSRRFDIKEALKKGENTLTIKYTTTLYNKMKKKGAKPQPSGLMGPVRLIRE